MLHSLKSVIQNNVICYGLSECRSTRPKALISGTGFNIEDECEQLDNYIILDNHYVNNETHDLAHNKLKFFFLHKDNTALPAYSELTQSVALIELMKYSNIHQQDRDFSQCSQMLAHADFFKLYVGDFSSHINKLST